VGGVWRRTSETIDPLDTGDADGELNLVTKYDYTTIEPESGAWGNATLVIEPGSAYQTVTYYDKADRVLLRKRTCDGHTVSETRYSYCTDGKLLGVTRAAGTPAESSTAYEYDEMGRRTAMYEDVADCRCSCGEWSGTVRGNVSLYEYYDGTSRVRREYRKAGWSEAAPVLMKSYEYEVDGKLSKVTDALGNETVYAYDDLRRLAQVRRDIDPDADPPQYVYTTYTYDNLDRRTETKVYDENPEGKPAPAPVSHTEKAYDAMGRVYQEIEHHPVHDNAITTNYFYDEIGQLVELRDPAGNARQFAFDNAGRKVKEWDALAEPNEVYYTYDPKGRLLVVERKQTDLEEDRRELTINYYDDNGLMAAAANWGTNTPSAQWSWATEPVHPTTTTSSPPTPTASTRRRAISGASPIRREWSRPPTWTRSAALPRLSKTKAESPAPPCSPTTCRNRARAGTTTPSRPKTSRTTTR